MAFQQGNQFGCRIYPIGAVAVFKQLRGHVEQGARVFRTLLGLVRKTPGGAAIPEMPRHAALAEAAGVTDVEAAGAVADLIARGIAKRDYPGLAILDAAALHRAAYD